MIHETLDRVLLDVLVAGGYFKVREYENSP